MAPVPARESSSVAGPSAVPSPLWSRATSGGSRCFLRLTHMTEQVLQCPALTICCWIEFFMIETTTGRAYWRVECGSQSAFALQPMTHLTV
jgi:hypothetical protein